MKHEKERNPDLSIPQDATPESRPRRPYQKPEIQSEPLFETVALGAAKLIDDFFCDQPTAS